MPGRKRKSPETGNKERATKSQKITNKESPTKALPPVQNPTDSEQRSTRKRTPNDSAVAAVSKQTASSSGTLRRPTKTSSGGRKDAPRKDIYDIEDDSEVERTHDEAPQAPKEPLPTYETLPAEMRQMILEKLLDSDPTAATRIPQIQAFDRFLLPEAREQGRRFQILRERRERVEAMEAVSEEFSQQFQADYQAIKDLIWNDIMKAEPELFED